MNEPKNQNKPRSIYLLKVQGGPFVRAIDGAVDVYMAIFNREDAEFEAKRQSELYGFECYPVKVK